MNTNEEPGWFAMDMFLKKASLQNVSGGAYKKNIEARMERMSPTKGAVNNEMEGKKPISPSVRAEVYDRADGRCESCRERLSKTQGEFHHFAQPRITPSAETVQFLCSSCHKTYGHAIKVVVHRGLLRKWKETTVVRLQVKKHPKRVRMAPVKKPEVKKKAVWKKAPTKKPSAKRKPVRKKKVAKKPSRGSRSWFVPKS
jgi:hypothetical protein